MDAVYISTAIGPDRFASITKAEYEAVAHRIRKDEAMARELVDYRCRWVYADESDSPDAFATPPASLTKIKQFLEEETGNRETCILSASVLLRYLRLR